MYIYLAATSIASLSTAMASTLTNSMLLGKIKNEYYLGKDVPGQIVGLGLSLIFTYRFRHHPLKLGVITSSLYPCGVGCDVIASKQDDPVGLLVFGSILKSVSFVGPAGTHTTAIVTICKHHNSNVFGNHNMILSSLGATAGIVVGIYATTRLVDHDMSPMVTSFIYPIASYIGWRSVIRF